MPKKQSSNMFALHDSVKVKDGTTDPDFGTDISGWQGRIQEIDEESDPDHIVYLIAWDSITLDAMSLESLVRSDKEELFWESMYLFDEDLEAAPPRDEIEDVELTFRRIKEDLAQDFARFRNSAV